MLWMMAAGAALAADGSLAMGAEFTWNDPYTRTSGLRLTAATEPLPWLRAGVSAGAYLSGAEQVRTRLSAQLLEEHELALHVSPMLARGLGEVTWIPVRSQGERLRESLGFTMGFGAVFTDDDTEVLGIYPGDAEHRSTYEAHDRELHPATQLGLVGELRGEVWGLRLRLERVRYVEIFGAEYAPDRAPTWLGVEAAWYPGSR